MATRLGTVGEQIGRWRILGWAPNNNGLYRVMCVDCRTGRSTSYKQIGQIATCNCPEYRRPVSVIHQPYIPPTTPLPLSRRVWNIGNHGKLQIRDVFAIRAYAREHPVPASQSQRMVYLRRLGLKYGVNSATIRAVIDRTSWVRIPMPPVYYQPSAPASLFSSWWLTIWLFLMLLHRGSGGTDPTDELTHVLTQQDM